MNGRTSHSLRVLLLVFTIMAVAALACSVDTGTGGTTGGSSDSGGSTSGTTGGSGTTTGGTTGGTTTGGSNPTKEPKPTSSGINVENAPDLKEVQAIHASDVSILAGGLSPIVHQGATYSTDRFVRIFDVDDGRQLYELPGHADVGFGLAYSPDGTTIATGGGFQVIFWDAETGAKLRTSTPNAQVYRLTFSPDSQLLAVVGERSSKIDLFDVQSGKRVNLISTEANNVLWAVQFSPDNENLAVADYQGAVTVYDGPSAGAVAWSAQGSGAAWDMEYSPDGSLLTTCNGSGDVYTWNTSDGSQYSNLTGTDVHPGGCTDSVYSPNGEVLFTVGSDFVLNAWDVATGDLLFTKTYNVGIWTVSITGDGELIALAMDNGDFRVLGVK